jgi:hypothetical protein
MTERPLTLFRGGLWNKFCVWICLENDEAPRLALRTFLVLGITWVPLAVLCLWNGTAWGTKVTAPFFLDPGDLFRLLVTPPLLLLAERIMDREFGSVVNYFQSSGIVREEDQATYGRTVDRCQHWMTNMWVEIALLVLLFLTLFFFLDIGQGFPSTVSNWKRDVVTGDPSAASYYYRYVTSVVYRFLVFRWAWRFFVWSVFLLKMSRFRLNLHPTHPDSAGGLGILGESQACFVLLGVALSANVAGIIARAVLYEGVTVQSHQFLMGGVVLVLSIIALLPLFAFTAKLTECKRQGLRLYGCLAHRYAGLFGKKWLARSVPDDTDLLGSADIQSLADLAGGYAVVEGMRLFPMRGKIVPFIAIAIAAPFVPLIFFVYNAQELVVRILTVLL